MAASSSTISTVPGDHVSSRALSRRLIIVSGIYDLPEHREFHGERGALSGCAVHVNFAGMFLDDAVRHREPQPRTAGIAALGLLVLGGEERIVNAMNVLLRNTTAGVGHSDAHVVAVAR